MFNQFTGIGNLARDPETRYSQEGKAIANFTVCCDHGWGEHKKTEFVKVVAFGKLAEIVGQYLTKGSRCMVQGPMQTRKWQDKDGQDRYTTEIVANEMKMLSGRNDSASGEGGPNYYPPAPGQDDMGQDVPF